MLERAEAVTRSGGYTYVEYVVDAYRRHDWRKLRSYSAPNPIGPTPLGAKPAGRRGSGNPLAPFDAAGAGDGAVRPPY